MNGENQIKEMCKVAYEAVFNYESCDSCPFMGQDITCIECAISCGLYNAGYRKQSEAEWEKVINHRECSKCGYNAPYKKIKAGYHLQDLTNYCPNCGAKMKGVKHSD